MKQPGDDQSQQGEPQGDHTLERFVEQQMTVQKQQQPEQQAVSGHPAEPGIAFDRRQEIHR
ncbi:hypothetical protein D3C73_1592430 [compost metagenome]